MVIIRHILSMILYIYMYIYKKQRWEPSQGNGKGNIILYLSIVLEIFPYALIIMCIYRIHCS